MKFNIQISKIGNQFFYISNLSEWSSYCRKNYNDLWLKNNPLNNKEKNELDKLCDILKQKRYKLINPSLTALNEKNFWKNVSKILSEKQQTVLREALIIFSERFEKIWAKEEKNLKLIKENIVKNISVSQKLISLIKQLYGIKKEPKNIDIFLYTNPIKKRLVSGGSGLGFGKIGVECSKITKENNKKEMLARVILHEIVHSCFEEDLIKKIKKFISLKTFKHKYQKLISESKIFKQVNNILGPIKELIIVSLLPEGYLAEKFFDLDIMKNLRERKRVKNKELEKNYYDLMIFGIFKMYKIAKDYSDNEKPLDENYIEESMRCWMEFENMDLNNLRI